MRKTRLPVGVYNALPYLYVCTGLFTIIVLRNALAVFSALILVSAGAVVWTLRYRYRQGFSRTEGPVDASDITDRHAPAGMLQPLCWHDSFESGHPVIDAQRLRLFGLGNELIQAVLIRRSHAEVEWLVDDLVENIMEHFSTEESVLAETNHPTFKEHQKTHWSLLAKVTDMRDDFLRGQVVSRDLVAFIAYDVIADHIIREDLRYAVTDH